MSQERFYINNRYTLNRISRRKGGFAEVFKAYDSNFEEDCAFKRPLPGTNLTDEECQRYQNEAVAVRRCEHPNVIKITGFEFDYEDKSPFLIMEWCEYSLGDRLRDDPNPLPWSDAFKYVKEVCKGVHYAHTLKDGQGPIIHRDIKPKNIMLSGDVPLIADFGTALRKHALSGVARWQGTSEYMSPEQWEGATANCLTDIYALGISLFELIENRLPFNGKNDIELAAQHHNQPLKWFMDVPEDVRQVVEKAAAKGPSERFQSAKTMADAIQSCLDRHGIPENKADEAENAEQRYGVLTKSQPSSDLGDSPEVIDLLVESAQFLIEKGEATKARHRLTEAINRNPDDPNLYRLRAKACTPMFLDQAKQDLTYGIRLYELACADDSSLVTDVLAAELYDLRGSVCHLLGQLEESAADYRTASKTDGSVIDYRIHSALARLANCEFEAAVVDLEAALALDAESYDARYVLYEVYMRDGQYGAAKSQLDWLIGDQRTESRDSQTRLRLYKHRAICSARLSSAEDTDGTEKLMSALADSKVAEAVESENRTVPVVHTGSSTLNLPTDYQIMERLGGEGLSHVFRARHLLDKDDVAVKVPAPWVENDSELLNGFALGELLAKECDHPNVVETIKVVRGNGLCYSVMELLGQDLHSFITERERVSLIDALRYSSQMCDALDRVHSFGIVHNDVKPSNMLLSLDERDVKLSEFLVSMPISDDYALMISDEIEPTVSWQNKGSGGQSPSTEGIRVGTEMYMAPEIIARQSRSARSDIYSLGVSLCEMLSPSTARTIFEVGNDTRIVSPDYSQTDGVARILNEELSLAGIPGEVIEVIKCATAADPELRFENAVAMKEAISGLQKGLKDEI